MFVASAVILDSVPVFVEDVVVVLLGEVLHEVDVAAVLLFESAVIVAVVPGGFVVVVAVGYTMGTGIVTWVYTRVLGVCRVHVLL